MNGRFEESLCLCRFTLEFTALDILFGGMDIPDASRFGSRLKISKDFQAVVLNQR